MRRRRKPLQLAIKTKLSFLVHVHVEAQVRCELPRCGVHEKRINKMPPTASNMLSRPTDRQAVRERERERATGKLTEIATGRQTVLGEGDPRTI